MVAVGRERLVEHRLQFGRPRHALAHFDERARPTGETENQTLHRSCVREGVVTRESNKRHQRQRVEITALIQRFAGNLLGTHELGRSYHHACLRHALVGARHRARNSKVDELHTVRTVRVAREHDVVGLDVTM